MTTTLTWTAWSSSPFWIDTGTSPEEPPIGTWAEVMILTFLSALLR